MKRQVSVLVSNVEEKKRKKVTGLMWSINTESSAPIISYTSYTKCYYINYIWHLWLIAISGLSSYKTSFKCGIHNLLINSEAGIYWIISLEWSEQLEHINRYVIKTAQWGHSRRFHWRAASKSHKGNIKEIHEINVKISHWTWIKMADQLI